MIRLFDLLLCSLLMLIAVPVNAQIAVNTETPSSSAVLHIEAVNNNQGLLIPSMTTAQKLAIANPAPSLLVYDKGNKCISQYKDSPSSPGVYSWTCLTLYNRHFLYMPTVNIPTANASGTILSGIQTLDLYAPYQSGFDTPKKKNTSAPASIACFGRSQLNYYVTYCDPFITVIGITDSGVLSYTVNNLPNYDAYINIVFIIK